MSKRAAEEDHSVPGKQAKDDKGPSRRRNIGSSFRVSPERDVTSNTEVLSEIVSDLKFTPADFVVLFFFRRSATEKHGV